MEEVAIIQEQITEFEFETFSVFFDKEKNIWFLEIYGDDEEMERFPIEDTEDIVYTTNSEKFRELEFYEEDFLKLKNFIQEEKQK